MDVTNSNKCLIPAYDLVGQYNQDEVNGFDNDFLDAFIDDLNIQSGECVLDAMGGNGNLSSRIIKRVAAAGLKKLSLNLLEFSGVQVQIAKSQLDPSIHIVQGDVLRLGEDAQSSFWSNESFDLIVIKSGHHEIPAFQQVPLYRSLFKALKPGGRYINLGFQFDNVQEREEFTQITRRKDHLVGADWAVKNRYFPLRREYEAALLTAGFEDIQTLKPFEYRIRSSVAFAEYFNKEELAMKSKEIFEVQKSAVSLNHSGRILWDNGGSLMKLPGEITRAVKPFGK